MVQLSLGYVREILFRIDLNGISCLLGVAYRKDNVFDFSLLFIGGFHLICK
jgi:hypothetical protein